MPNQLSHSSQDTIWHLSASTRLAWLIFLALPNFIRELTFLLVPSFSPSIHSFNLLQFGFYPQTVTETGSLKLTAEHQIGKKASRFNLTHSSSVQFPIKISLTWLLLRRWACLQCLWWLLSVLCCLLLFCIKVAVSQGAALGPLSSLSLLPLQLWCYHPPCWLQISPLCLQVWSWTSFCSLERIVCIFSTQECPFHVGNYGETPGKDAEDLHRDVMNLSWFTKYTAGKINRTVMG